MALKSVNGRNAWKKLKTPEGTYQVRFGGGDFEVRDVDIEALHIAEILSGTYPGLASFFKICRRLLKANGEEAFAKFWRQMNYGHSSHGNERSGDEVSLRIAHRFYIWDPTYFSRNSAIPHEMIETLLLAPDKTYLTRAIHSENLRISTRLLEKAYARGKQYVALEVASHPNANETLLDQIAHEDHNFPTFEAICKHPNVTSKTIDYIASLPGGGRFALASPKVSKTLLRKYSYSMDLSDVAAVCLNINTPKAVLKRLSKDKREFWPKTLPLSTKLLGNPNLSDEMILEIVKNNRPHFRGDKEISLT